MYGWIAINDGGVWRNINGGIQVNDNGTWRQITNVEVNDNGTWRPVFEVWHPNVSVEAATDPTFGLARAGTTTGSLAVPSVPNWYWGDDISATIGDNYALHVSLVSGTPPTPTGFAYDTWTLISGTRALTQTGNGNSSITKWSIATDTAGSNLHLTFFLTLRNT